MPGLVPGIHVLMHQQEEDVDGRDKPGHDDEVGQCHHAGRGGGPLRSYRLPAPPPGKRAVRFRTPPIPALPYVSVIGIADDADQRIERRMPQQTGA
jgi:hypothetical protein